MMAIPNLFGILLLSKDMKQTNARYWQHFLRDNPDEKCPEKGKFINVLKKNVFKA